MDVVVRNGTLVTPTGTFPADVGIVGERIAALVRQDGGGELLRIGTGALRAAKAAGRPPLAVS